MAGHAANRFVIVKVVAELGHIGVVFVLALGQLALQQALVPQPGAQVLHQHRVFGPALGQQIAHTVQHRQHGAEVGLFVFTLHHWAHGHHIRLCCLHGNERRVGKQRIGQRLQPGFFGQLAFGAALELEGQVNVFHLLLGGRIVDGYRERGRQLALLFNSLDDRLFTVAQFAQVREACFQFAQLDVVEAVGHLLAVAGDKRHGGTAVQELHGGFHLGGADFDFLRELRDDVLHKQRNQYRGPPAGPKAEMSVVKESLKSEREVCHSPPAVFWPAYWGKRGFCARQFGCDGRPKLAVQRPLE